MELYDSEVHEDDHLAGWRVTMKRSMSIAVGLIAAAGLVTIGYRHHVANTESVTALKTERALDIHTVTSLSFTDASQRAIAPIESRFDDIALKDPGAAEVLARLNPVTTLAKRLSRIALTVRLNKQVSKADRKALQSDYLDGFIGNREETVAEAKRVIDALAEPRFASERMGVYATLRRMPDDTTVVRQLTLDELTRRPPPARPVFAADAPLDVRRQAASMGAAQVLPVMAYSMFVDASGNDADRVLAPTIRVLQSQSDVGIRDLILTAYLTYFPDHKAALYDQASAAGLTLPDRQPQTPSAVSFSATPPRILAQQ